MRPVLLSARVVLLLCVLVADGASAAGRAKPPRVDREAMREAMDAAAADDGSTASSASYAHFLQSRLMHWDGDHRGSVDELRLALATDEGNPLLLTRLGEEYARAGDLDRAERELKRAVEKAPTYYAAHVMLGRVLLEGGRLTRARQHLRRAMSLRPRDPEAYLVLAQLELEGGAPAEAVKVVDALAVALPGEASGYQRLGLALAERGDSARAERLLQKATERDPGDVDSWTALAHLYDGTGRAAEAEEALAKALQGDPDRQDVLLAAGRAALKAGSPVRARAYFDRLLSLTDEPETAVRVAFSYLSARQTDAAAEVLDTAHKVAPSEPRLPYYLGLVLERQRRFSAAASAFAEVPASAEVFVDARTRRARCLSLAGEHARALALFRAAQQDAPEDLDLRVLHARALERGGAPAKAEALLREALATAPTPLVYDALAATLERQGKGAEALALLGAALAKSPRDPGLLYSLATVHERQGQLDAARARIRELLTVEPDHASAMNFLGYLLASSGRELDEAERLVARALRLRPDTGAFLDSLGWVYFHRGETQRAVDALERASELAPDEPVILEHLGDAYAQARRAADAARVWRRAVEVLALEPEAAEPADQRLGLERKLKALSTAATGR
ncbi:tetratricopeptide repeat protein [Myxococcaceae bacterium JPH2]|nr:tetratricopeptide repeat protein [Myxococcaceae bacterium JPH2]